MVAGIHPLLILMGVLLLLMLTVAVLSGRIGRKVGRAKPGKIIWFLLFLILPTLYFSCQQPHLPPLIPNFNSPYERELYRSDLLSEEKYGDPVIVHIVRKSGCPWCGQGEVEARKWCNPNEPSISLSGEAIPCFWDKLEIIYYDIDASNPIVRANERENQGVLYQRIAAQIRAFRKYDACRLPPDRETVPFIAVEDVDGSFPICGVDQIQEGGTFKQKVVAYLDAHLPSIPSAFGDAAKLRFVVLMQGKDQTFWLEPTGLIPSYSIHIPTEIIGLKTLETGGGVTPFFKKQAVQDAVDRLLIPRDLEFLMVKPVNSSVLVRGPNFTTSNGQYTAPPGTIYNLFVYDSYTKTWLCPAGSSDCVVTLLNVVVFTSSGPIEGFIPISDLDKSTPGQMLAATTEKDLEAIPGAPVNSAPTAGAEVVQAAPEEPTVAPVNSVPSLVWLVTDSSNRINICALVNGNLDCTQVPASISGQAKLKTDTNVYDDRGNPDQNGKFGKIVDVVEVQGITDSSAPNFETWRRGLIDKFIPLDNLQPAQ